MLRAARRRRRSCVGETDELCREPVVGEGGLEPPHPFGHRHLKPARLPIPPLARTMQRTSEVARTFPAFARVRARLQPTRTRRTPCPRPRCPTSVRWVRSPAPRKVMPEPSSRRRSTSGRRSTRSVPSTIARGVCSGSTPARGVADRLRAGTEQRRGRPVPHRSRLLAGEGIAGQHLASRRLTRPQNPKGAPVHSLANGTPGVRAQARAAGRGYLQQGLPQRAPARRDRAPYGPRARRGTHPRSERAPRRSQQHRRVPVAGRRRALPVVLRGARPRARRSRPSARTRRGLPVPRPGDGHAPVRRLVEEGRRSTWWPRSPRARAGRWARWC